MTDECKQSESKTPTVLSYASSKDGSSGHNRLIFWLIMLAALLMISVWRQVIVSPQARGPDFMRHCRGNLHQFGIALNTYMAENRDAYPASLEELVEYSSLDDSIPYILHCPEAKKKRGRYVLIRHEKMSRFATSQPAIYEQLGNHKKLKGANVLFLDGHVEWVKPGRYKKLLARYIDSVDPEKQEDIQSAE